MKHLRKALACILVLTLCFSIFTITAKQARARINALETKRGKEEKAIAEEKINAATENGKDHCYLGIKISDATKKWLESEPNCYTVTILSEDKPGEEDTKVSW